MKILFIHHGNVLGGAPLSLLYLTRELEKRSDVDLSIAAHSHEMQGFFSKNLKSEVIPWPTTNTHMMKFFIGWIPWKAMFTNFQTWRRFVSEFLKFPVSVLKQLGTLKKMKVNLVHLNSATLLSSAIAAYLAGLPMVWHIREPLQGINVQQRIMGSIIRGLAKAVITISEVEALRLGVDTKKNVHVIYNPINVDMLKPERYNQVREKKNLGLLETDKLVISLGGVNPRKGTLEIVEAMKYVSPNVYLFIAGPPLISGNQEDHYHQKIKQLMLELPDGKVKFLGNLENVVPLLAACDLLIFAGTKPHFPRPVFEAWQMQKPVIVFDMPGISNQIDHMTDGFIVKEISGHAFGVALENLLNDNDLLIAMGKNGWKKAEEKCNPKSVANQVLQVYKEILN